MVKVISPLNILRRKQVQARTGLSRSAIYQRVKAGTFPPQVSLGERTVGWIESEINSWLTARIEASRNSPALEGQS
jgi:prophage regulatory protein